MLAAIFLDRDGVIIENRPTYVRSWADVAFYPQALDALGKISSSPYKIVVVTNQSAVGRGLITLETAMQINHQVVETIVGQGGRIDGIFMCPHAPEDGCDCRKPQPGLFFQAAQALALDLQRSSLVGDAYSDLLAGQAANLHQTAIVRTGRGEAQLLLPKPAGLKTFLTFDSLADALNDLAWLA